MILSMLSNRGSGILRSLAAVAVLAVWLGIAGVGGIAVGQLSEVQENDAAGFLPDTAESTQVAQVAASFVDDKSLPALVVITGDGKLSTAQMAEAGAFTQQIPGLRVGEEETLGEQLVGDPVLIPSEDGEAVLVSVPLDAVSARDQIDEQPVVNLAVSAIRDSAADLGDQGLTAYVTGPAGAIADLVEAFGGIDSLLLVVAVVMVLIILVLVYRSPSLPFTVLITALFALSGAALVVYQLAANGVLVLNGQSQGILFILVVGAATDYSLLIVARYREELRLLEQPHQALNRAVRASIAPIAASAGTVIAALLCLLLSDLSSNRSLGPVGAIGIAAAFVASLTLLPALLMIGGRYARWIFWPRMPRAADVDPNTDANSESWEQVVEHTGVWGRIAAAVGRNPRKVWVLTAVALIAAAAWAPTFRAQGVGESDVFLADVDSVTGEQVLAQHFDAGQVQPAEVIAPADDLADVVQAATDVPGVVSAVPVTSGPPGAGGDPLVVDDRVLVQVSTRTGAETQEAVDVVADLRTAVHDASPDALVGGSAAERLDNQQTSARDLWVIVPAVLVVILLVLIGLLRAVVAPLLIVAANLLSFGATLGVGALVFNNVLGFPGADAAVPLYAFVFLVALGIDYSIFLMTRVREESFKHGTRTGALRGLAVTGGVITSAGLVLAATFGALAVIPILFLAQISFLVGFGVLVDALVVRTLLVPGLVHDVGRRTWWPWMQRTPRD
jgi:putative drug exporter of the RND superfamily